MMCARRQVEMLNVTVEVVDHDRNVAVDNSLRRLGPDIETQGAGRVTAGRRVWVRFRVGIMMWVGIPIRVCAAAQGAVVPVRAKCQGTPALPP